MLDNHAIPSKSSNSRIQKNVLCLIVESCLALAVFCRCSTSAHIGVRKRKLGGLRESLPLKILTAGLMLAWRRLISSTKSLSWRNLSYCLTWRWPLTSSVERRWTLTRWLISDLRFGSFPLHTMGVAPRRKKRLIWTTWRIAWGSYIANVLLYSMYLFNALIRYVSRGRPMSLTQLIWGIE